ncbi:hypothetical protein NIES4073_53950 [Kalymmatonema gypsitolerans NIES-4073]|nr:hypothetical protein NIES4073_53950 [Scytonema sp. NIES-4073]
MIASDGRLLTLMFYANPNSYDYRGFLAKSRLYANCESMYRPFARQENLLVAIAEGSAQGAIAI